MGQKFSRSCRVEDTYRQITRSNREYWHKKNVGQRFTADVKRYYGVPSVKLFHGQKWIIYVICRMLTFINVMCKFMRDMRYLICCMFSSICNVSRFIYDISILLRSMSETIYVVSQNPFACFNSFITWAKIALSVSFFVASSFLCCIYKIIHLCSKLYVALAKLYVALADSPFEFYYWVIFRHDFSLGSNFHKVPHESNIPKTDFHKSNL